MARRPAGWSDPALPGQGAEIGFGIATGVADRRDGQWHHIDEICVPARRESVSAEHFRQTLGVEPGDHADHRRIGRPLIYQFGGLCRGVDARDVQGTLTCLRVTPVEATDRQPGGIGRGQVEVREVDTQVQPGLLVTVAADDGDLPGPATRVQTRRLRVDEDQSPCHQSSWLLRAGITRAPLVRGYRGLDLGDVLTAAVPGGLAAAWAGDGVTHGVLLTGCVRDYAGPG